MYDTAETSRILVADDDTATRQVIVEALNYVKDCSTLEASNGAEALSLLSKHRCGMVITDVRMPVMGGIELLDRIMEINPLTHVIVMTGYPSIDLSVCAMKSGAVDFLVKPFNIDDLLHRVNLFLREKSTLEESVAGNRSKVVLRHIINELSTQSYIYDIIEETCNSNERIFQEMADTALKVSQGESCSLLLFDEERNEFRPKVMKNLSSEHTLDLQSPSLLSILQKVIQDREACIINSFSGHEGPSSLILAPLRIRNRVFGVLGISRRKNGVEFTPTVLNYILSLTKRASLNIENNLLYESTYANLMDTLKSMAASIQARDHYTESHSIRVTELAVRTCEAIGGRPEDVESLKIAGILHDIGKIAVPDDILLKPGRLTEEEYEIIKQHPLTGENIIKPIMLLDRERLLIRHHHERWDGRGYPDGLTGEDIPFLSRILAVADSFDAMTNNRPYRKAMAVERAVEELRKNAGLQFDREVVHCFLTINKEAGHGSLQ